jgi:lysophospholipase L1-like esterase
VGNSRQRRLDPNVAYVLRFCAPDPRIRGIPPAICEFLTSARLLSKGAAAMTSLKVRFAILALFLFAFFSAYADTQQPKVVFIGDWITYYWDAAFAANPDWINKGLPGETTESFGTAEEVLARFQADVVSLHPSVVHILIGQGDALRIADGHSTEALPNFLRGLNAIVEEARAANIQVILGMEPPLVSSYGPLEQINSIIASYGAKHYIHVINYSDALCECVNARLQPYQAYSTGRDPYTQFGGGPYVVESPTDSSEASLYPRVISAIGYAKMTQMVETDIANITSDLNYGWLQNVLQKPEPGVTSSNQLAEAIDVNTVEPGATVQFTPIGHYTNGSHHPFLNTSFEGSDGTWTSSDPLVMYVNQAGRSWAISRGTAIIRFVSPRGLRFCEWIMYVK